MLLSIPDGRSRQSEFGYLGFPWLAIANIVINAAYGGWSYYRTNQQVKQAMAISGVGTASDSELKASAEEFKLKTGSPLSVNQIQSYLRGLVQSAPTKAQGMPPSDLLEIKSEIARLRLEMQEGKEEGMPTWGWAVIGGVAFLALMQFGVLKRGG